MGGIRGIDNDPLWPKEPVKKSSPLSKAGKVVKSYLGEAARATGADKLGAQTPVRSAIRTMQKGLDVAKKLYPGGREGAALQKIDHALQEFTRITGEQWGPEEELVRRG